MENDGLFMQIGQVCLPLQLHSSCNSVYWLSELGFIVLQDICIIVESRLQLDTIQSQ